MCTSGWTGRRVNSEKDLTSARLPHRRLFSAEVLNLLQLWINAKKVNDLCHRVACTRKIFSRSLSLSRPYWYHLLVRGGYVDVR